MWGSVTTQGGFGGLSFSGIPMPGKEQIADLPYPLSGVDVSAALHEQRQGTTPLGTNCRTCEPTSYRMRGGSRPGLVRQFEQVPGGPSLIQNLNTVDPTNNGALLDSQYVIGGGFGGPGGDGGGGAGFPGLRLQGLTSGQAGGLP